MEVGPIPEIAILADLEAADAPPFAGGQWFRERSALGQKWLFYRIGALVVAAWADPSPKPMIGTPVRYAVFHGDRWAVTYYAHMKPFGTLGELKAWIAKELQREVGRCGRLLDEAEAELRKRQKQMTDAQAAVVAFDGGAV